jgi:FtsH-binding integral membrane protein
MDGDNQDHDRGSNGGAWTKEQHFEDFANQSLLSARARRHLTNMYGHLAVTSLLAMFACYLQVTGVVSGGGLLPAVGGMATLWSLSRVRNEPVRQLMLYGFGFLEGLAVAPLVDIVYALDPSILISVFAMTALVFAGFSATALMSPRRSFFYLGSLISAGLSILLTASLFSLFYHHSILDNLMLYVGLLVFSLMITLDTQLVVERVESDNLGRADAVVDAANMLINIIGIARRLLVIMSQQETRERRDRRRKRN